MTNVPPGPDASPAAPDDDRGDPQLAALLEVPPLDETTRRRLVRTASDAAIPSPGRSGAKSGQLGAAMGVAAALLVGAVVGAVVVTRPSEPDTRAASRASSTAPTTAAAEAAAPAPQSADAEVSADASGAPPQEIGDLGTVRGTAELRAAISAAFERGAGATRSDAAPTPCGDRDASLLGLVSISAVGEAQLDGLPVVVLVGPSPSGEDQVFVLDPARGCEIVENLAL